MINPANNSNVDNGVTFIQYVWDECKPELEVLDQNDINNIWKIVFRNSPRPNVFFDQKDDFPPCTPDKIKQDGYKMARVQMLNGIEAIKGLKKDAPENLKASFETDLDKMVYALKKLDEAENKTNQVLASIKNKKIHNDLEEKHNEDAANKKHLDSAKKK